MINRDRTVSCTTVERRSNDLDLSYQAGDQGFDLLFLVELRGFEPLTPSMRTQCSSGQSTLVTVLAQVGDLRRVTITASDAA